MTAFATGGLFTEGFQRGVHKTAGGATMGKD